MNSDKIKGTMDDAAGRAKRQVGEWTGDTETQIDGATQQVKGKAEKVVGNVRDALHSNKDDVTRNPERTDDDRDRESDAAVRRDKDR